jgi:hypothetical protein
LLQERINRLKHLHWHTHQLSAELSSNLAPIEVEFLSQYDKNLKKFAEACHLSTDLSMDAAPPKSRCVQVASFCASLLELLEPGTKGWTSISSAQLSFFSVQHLVRPCNLNLLHWSAVIRKTSVRCMQVRVLADHGDMMSKDGKVVLRKDTTHWLPVDEVEALIRAGVVEYLHAGMTM